MLLNSPFLDRNPPTVHKIRYSVARHQTSLDCVRVSTHRGVGHAHLQAYLDEFVFRFNRRRTSMAAFQTLLGLAASSNPRPTSTCTEWSQTDRQKCSYHGLSVWKDRICSHTYSI